MEWTNRKGYCHTLFSEIIYRMVFEVMLLSNVFEFIILLIMFSYTWKHSSNKIIFYALDCGWCAVRVRTGFCLGGCKLCRPYLFVMSGVIVLCSGRRIKIKLVNTIICKALRLISIFLISNCDIYINFNPCCNIDRDRPGPGPGPGIVLWTVLYY